MRGMGIDMVQVSRITALDNRYGIQFRSKVMAPCEVAETSTSLAGLWAAKEAVAKALGCGFKGFGPSSIAILNDENGAPYVELLGIAQEVSVTLGITRIHVSISHDGGFAIACAIAV